MVIVDEFSARNLGDKEITKGNVFLTKEKRENNNKLVYSLQTHKLLKINSLLWTKTHMLMKNELSH